VTKIWAVAQHRDGKLHRGSFEAIAAAQRLAEATGGKAEAIVLGSGVAGLAAELAANALGAVRVVDHPALSSYTPGGYVTALAAALTAAGADRPDFVLFPHSYQSCEYVPRLAQASGAAHLPEAIGFESEGGTLTWKRPILEGKLHARVRVKGGGTALVTLQSGAFAADSRRSGQAPIESLSVELAGVELGREILGTEQAGGDTVDLTKAQSIVAVGRGVGGADRLGPIEELAKLLKADIGASRPVIDSGWLPRDRQIGSSGQTVARGKLMHLADTHGLRLDPGPGEPGASPTLLGFHRRRRRGPRAVRRPRRASYRRACRRTKRRPAHRASPRRAQSRWPA
jgi:electron transfer flavoprotein alpha subunit